MGVLFGNFEAWTNILTVYGIKVDARLPVLNVGTREKPTYLPADVCSIVKGQPAKAKLSPNQTAAMIRCAVQPPARNALAIKTDGISSLQLHANNGTLVSPQMTCIWHVVNLYRRLSESKWAVSS